MKHIGYLVYLISLSPMFGVDSLPVGTWVRRDAKEPVHITMKVEAAGAGLKLTYTIVSADTGGPDHDGVDATRRQGCSGNSRFQAKWSDDGYPIG